MFLKPVQDGSEEQYLVEKPNFSQKVVTFHFPLLSMCFPESMEYLDCTFLIQKFLAIISRPNSVCWYVPCVCIALLTFQTIFALLLAFDQTLEIKMSSEMAFISRYLIGKSRSKENISLVTLYWNLKSPVHWNQQHLLLIIYLIKLSCIMSPNVWL